jgi:hypothetical protein
MPLSVLLQRLPNTFNAAFKRCNTYKSARVSDRRRRRQSSTKSRSLHILKPGIIPDSPADFKRSTSLLWRMIRDRESGHCGKRSNLREIVPDQTRYHLPPDTAAR